MNEFNHSGWYYERRGETFLERTPIWNVLTTRGGVYTTFTGSRDALHRFIDTRLQATTDTEGAKERA